MADSLFLQPVMGRRAFGGGTLAASSLAFLAACGKKAIGYFKYRGIDTVLAFRDLSDILKDLDRDLVKGAFAGEHFAENFFPACKDEKLAATVKELMA